MYCRRRTAGTRGAWAPVPAQTPAKTATPTPTLTWPQQVTAPEGTIDVYQPQLEALKGNAVTGRAAVGLTATGKQAPVFGAFWFSSAVDVDRAANRVTFRDITVTNVRWPNMTPELEQRFKKAVEGAMPGTGLAMTYERFAASLATTDREQKSMAQLKTDPPAIVFSKQLAVLLLFDGEPRFKDLDNSPAGDATWPWSRPAADGRRAGNAFRRSDAPGSGCLRAAAGAAES